MGYETRCRVRTIDAAGTAREADATVLLEPDDLIVRGEARVRVSRATITSMDARDGRLVVVHPAGTLSLALGADAAKWLARLQAPPKARIDKLDVKPGARVWLAGVTDAALGDELRARTAAVGSGPTVPVGCDVVFLQVDRDDELARIGEVAAVLPPVGALWVVHPKGKGGVPDTAVFAAARAAGLTYTKVAAFSATHGAEKLVWPRARR